MKRELYLRQNAQHRPTIVYRLGYEAGFYSEYNCLVMCAVYCLKNNIRLNLNSSFANFKYKRGWEDFFEPFYSEDSRTFHKRYNYRLYGKRKNRLIENLYKKIYNIDYLTQDIWTAFRSHEFWDDKELICFAGEQLSFFECCHLLVDISYRFQPEVYQKIQRFEDQLHLPAKYVAFHIRRGDKFREAELISVNKYLSIAERETTIRSAFVFSDDYSTITHIENEFPEWKIYHNVDPNSKGYFHDEFTSRSQQRRYEDLIYLLSNVEIMCNSAVFVGSISTNIGMFVGMRRLNRDCFYVDSPTWRVW